MKELSTEANIIRKQDLFIVFDVFDKNWQRTCIPRYVPFYCAQLTNYLIDKNF